MPHMIAMQEFTYASGAITLRPGDKFFALSDFDAVLLEGVGKARHADAPTYARKDEEAETVGIDGAAPGPVVRVKRKYKRRDMNAGWSK